MVCRPISTEHKLGALAPTHATSILIKHLYTSTVVRNKCAVFGRTELSEQWQKLSSNLNLTLRHCIMMGWMEMSALSKY